MGFGPCRLRALPTIYRVPYEAHGWRETLSSGGNAVHCEGLEAAARLQNDLGVVVGLLLLISHGFSGCRKRGVEFKGEAVTTETPQPP